MTAIVSVAALGVIQRVFLPVVLTRCIACILMRTLG